MNRSPLNSGPLGSGVTPNWVSFSSYGRITANCAFTASGLVKQFVVDARLNSAVSIAPAALVAVKPNPTSVLASWSEVHWISAGQWLTPTAHIAAAMVVTPKVSKAIVFAATGQITAAVTRFGRVSRAIILNAAGQVTAGFALAARVSKAMFLDVVASVSAILREQFVTDKAFLGSGSVKADFSLTLDDFTKRPAPPDRRFRLSTERDRVFYMTKD